MNEHPDELSIEPIETSLQDTNYATKALPANPLKQTGAESKDGDPYVGIVIKCHCVGMSVFVTQCFLATTAIYLQWSLFICLSNNLTGNNL